MGKILQHPILATEEAMRDWASSIETKTFIAYLKTIQEDIVSEVMVDYEDGTEAKEIAKLKGAHQIVDRIRVNIDEYKLYEEKKNDN